LFVGSGLVAFGVGFEGDPSRSIEERQTRMTGRDRREKHGRSGIASGDGRPSDDFLAVAFPGFFLQAA